MGLIGKGHKTEQPTAGETPQILIPLNRGPTQTRTVASETNHAGHPQLAFFIPDPAGWISLAVVFVSTGPGDQSATGLQKRRSPAPSRCCCRHACHWRNFCRPGMKSTWGRLRSDRLSVSKRINIFFFAGKNLKNYYNFDIFN